MQNNTRTSLSFSLSGLTLAAIQSEFENNYYSELIVDYSKDGTDNHPNSLLFKQVYVREIIGLHPAETLGGILIFSYVKSILNKCGTHLHNCLAHITLEPI